MNEKIERFGIQTMDNTTESMIGIAKKVESYKDFPSRVFKNEGI